MRRERREPVGWDDDDDRPRRGERRDKPDSWPVWVMVVVPVAVVVVACMGLLVWISGGEKGRPTPAPPGGESVRPREKESSQPAPVTPVTPPPATPRIVDARVGEPVEVGKLKLVVVVEVRQFQDREFSLHEPATLVLLTLSIDDPSALLDVPSCSGAVRVSDDVGNVYKSLTLFTQFGTPTTLYEGQITAGHQTRLRREKPVADAAIFELPVEAASELRVEIDAKRYKGEGIIRLVVRRDQWTPKAPDPKPTKP
jgi:hypothetical protein